MARTRARVYVQVQNRINGKWSNYEASETLDEAIELMRELQKRYPEAHLRVLNKADGTIHTY